MKTTLQARLLQHLVKKNRNQGFTLIELLVVIIIIGILSAIALPSFLGQAAKAKQSEAKTTISSVNSAQVAYRTENNDFGTMAQLGLGLPENTSNYEYVITPEAATDFATITAESKDTAIKPYSGATQVVTANNQSAMRSLVCEANDPALGAAEAPAEGSGGAAPTCAEGYKNLSEEEEEAAPST